MKNRDYKEFAEGEIYHIYNRGNNREKIFFNDLNYNYFLNLYYKYTYRFIDTYSYCLLPNHFHILTKVKSEPELKNIIDTPKIDYVLCEQFRKFFMRYSKAINEQEDRIGSLFQKNFKRKPVLYDNHLNLLIAYIHTNPLHHSIYNDFTNYQWCSYRGIISSVPTKLKRNELLQYFGEKKDFVEYHKSYCDFRNIRELIDFDNL
jgi:putative transposase